MTTPRFNALDLDQFIQVLESFPWRRRIDSIHLHHTWRPNHAQYRGLESIESMWRFHTRDRGWSDIAQHLTVAPDGTLWTGRDWNRSPASASGFNGNSMVGPFMIEMIGDFDAGRDTFEGKQRAATLEAVAHLQGHFGLTADTLRFHNTMSPKTCPGDAVDYKELLDELHAVRARTKNAVRAARRAPRPFDDDALATRDVIDHLTDPRRVTRNIDETGAELPEADMAYQPPDGSWGGDGQRGRKVEITPQLLADLAPHLINLTQGRFSTEGLMRTSQGKVDTIFDVHLPRELAAAQAAGRPLRLVFYAHGGLVGEKAGLRGAHKHVAWWKANHVYPIYFVWETGLIQTLRQLGRGAQQDLAGSGQRGTRAPTDWIVANLIRPVGPKVWGGMKRSAARSVDEPRADADGQPDVAGGGGAHYLAQRLATFMGHHGNDVELHAVGHSAGSILHSHFLPTALRLGVPSFKSVQFLAPAITVQHFLDRLSDDMEQGRLGPLTIFTMREPLERADNVARIYRKSLLYLINKVLEPRRRTPILGLEESLNENRSMRFLFNLGGPVSPNAGEVVWSQTEKNDGRSASRSTSHGGFDDDVPTMDSVLRRVLGVSSTDPIKSIEPFLPEEQRGLGSDGLGGDDFELPEEVERELEDFGDFAPESPSRTTIPSIPASSPPLPATPPSAPLPVTPSPGGRRRALCVGIDKYPTAPLFACVADAQRWADTLLRLGFEIPTLLTDETADRPSILAALEDLVRGARPGDVLVFQYSGHGTQLTDLDGDEDDDFDEALCAIDFADGGFVIDDDLADIFSALPAGVNLTNFLDCCHSGSGTRMAAGGAAGRPTDPSARRRFLPRTAALDETHRQFRSRLGGARGSARGPESMREVTFSACQPEQVAWESNGQGDFTRHAVALLDQATLASLNHRGFQQHLEAAFGPFGRQRPMFDGAPGTLDHGLLQPLGAVQAPSMPTLAPAGGNLLAGVGYHRDVAALLQAVAELLKTRT